jgi:hypothetical protein
MVLYCGDSRLSAIIGAEVCGACKPHDVLYYTHT